MKDYCLPDYENTGLNVVSSALNHFGVKNEHRKHPAVEKLLEKKKYNKIIFMLFDGMGMDLLAHALPEDSFLRSHMLCEMSAAYPSTTACATTSIGTGMTPLEHGWLGWDLYFKEIDKTVAVFINVDEATGGSAADYNVGQRYAPLHEVYDSMETVGGKGHDISRFGTDVIGDLDEMREVILRLASDEVPRYMYCYWGEPDHTMHDKGCYDEHVLQEVTKIDRYVESLAAELPQDALLLVTADHGLVDAVWEYVSDHPALCDMLLRMPSVEPRAAAFYVRPECMEAFPAAFREAFGEEDFLLMKSEEFIARGFLGEGEEHPKVRDFAGDYMALAIGNKCIGGKRGRHELIGVHAGLTRKEMRVPLIAAKL